MTTGRINQVTIVARYPGLRPKAEGIDRRSGVEPKPDARAAQPPRPQPPGASRPIHLPPLSLPRGGPLQAWEFAARKVGPHCNIHPSVGGYQPPVTSGDGYGLRLTPDCLGDNDSHRPTIHRLLQSPRASPWVFRPPAPPLAKTHAGDFHYPTVAEWGDASPGQSQRLPSRRTLHRVTLAHGRWSCWFETSLKTDYRGPGGERRPAEAETPRPRGV